MALSLPVALEPYYVSSSVGSDAWSGRLAEPNRDRSDGPRASIEAAVDLLHDAAPGTHVLMRRGDRWTTLSEFVVSAAVGTPLDPIVFGAYGTGAQPIIEARHGGSVLLIRGNANDATSYFWLRDLHITAANPALAQNGIYVGESLYANPPHHLTFSQMTIEGNGAGMIMYGDSITVHGSRIANNVLGMGVYVTGNDVIFQYNEFENNGLPPPDLFYHSLYISGCDGMLFEHNVVHSATDGVKVRATDNSVFRYNTFRDLDAIGIHLGGDFSIGSVGNRIEGNLFYRNSSDIVIKSESGVQIDLLDDLVIANNVMAHASGGFNGYGAHLAITSMPARNVSVVNNLVYESGSYDGILILNDGDDIFCDNNVVGLFGSGTAYNLDAAVSESNNLEFLSSDAFESVYRTDPENVDFEINADSQVLIDQGTDVSSVSRRDFRGRPRPHGPEFDIGPYEYSP